MDNSPLSGMVLSWINTLEHYITGWVDHTDPLSFRGFGKHSNPWGKDGVHEPGYKSLQEKVGTNRMYYLPLSQLSQP